jgi:hypothetical protein
MNQRHEDVYDCNGDIMVPAKNKKWFTETFSTPWGYKSAKVGWFHHETVGAYRDLVKAGDTYYKTRVEAEVEAKAWAEREGLEYKAGVNWQ